MHLLHRDQHDSDDAPKPFKIYWDSEVNYYLNSFNVTHPRKNISDWIVKFGGLFAFKLCCGSWNVQRSLLAMRPIVISLGEPIEFLMKSPTPLPPSASPAPIKMVLIAQSATF